VPLPVSNPEVAKEWHYEKNMGFKPAQFSAGSAVRAWWICADLHEWEAPISQRTRRNSNCPKCVNIGRLGKPKVKNRQPLEITHPHLVKEWHPELNGSLTAAQVHAWTIKSVAWQCPIFDEHVWNAGIYRRAIYNRGCPKCTHWLVEPSQSLKAVEPELAKQWHKTKNGSLVPNQVSPGSKKIVWWQCKSKKHEWEARIRDRVRTSFSCRFCAREQMEENSRSFAQIESYDERRHDFNGPSLASKYRKIAGEWNYEKNCGKTPKDFSYTSNIAAWWTCSKNENHVYKMRIRQRTVQRSICPYCPRGEQLQAPNTLKDGDPEIARQFHRKLNGKLKPSKISWTSLERVWWQCPLNEKHVWQCKVYDRTKRRTGCPHCRKEPKAKDSGSH